MPIPQLSSLLLKTKGLPIISPTVSLWLDLVASEAEFSSLCTALRGIPAGWVDWTEAIVNRAIVRGITVSKPLPYRLAVLLNGIVNLQECKYLVDAMENALRVEALEHARREGIGLNDIIKTVPEHWKMIPVPASLPQLIASSSFYQLTELFIRNWEHVWVYSKPRKNAVPGFWKVFQSNGRCRDVKQFRRAMTSARSYRNTIAHTKRLFAFADIDQLYVRMYQWFKAMHLDIDSRIMTYRGMRPRFLDGLIEYHNQTY